MKKVVVGAALSSCICLFLVMIFIQSKNHHLLQAIEQEGSSALGVPIHVNAIKTDKKQGIAQLSELTIANPENYKANYALEVEQIQVKLDYEQQHIEEVIIDKPTINAEVDETKNNFQDLLENLPLTAPEPIANSNNELFIKQIKFTQPDINLLSGTYVIGQQTIPAKDFIIQDLSGSPREIAHQLLVKFTNHIAFLIQSYVKQRSNHQMNEEIADKATESLNELVDKKIKNKEREIEFYLGY